MSNPHRGGHRSFDPCVITFIMRAVHNQRDFEAFLSSCTAMVALMLLFGAGLWPNLLSSNPHPGLSLTAYNAASSSLTLGHMLIIAVIGGPVVLAYTFSVYRIFRGKVQREHLVY